MTTEETGVRRHRLECPRCGGVVISWRVTATGAKRAERGARTCACTVDEMLAFHEQAKNDAHAAAICAKWVRRLGLGFHLDTAGADYRPPLSPPEVEEYERDRDVIFGVVDDPYAFGVDAMEKAGLLK